MTDRTMQRIEPRFSKMAFINSSLFGFEELRFELSNGDPVPMIYLKGENSAGKTTAMNAIQFAFIPDVSDMHLNNNTVEPGAKGASGKPSKDLAFFFPKIGESFILYEFRNCRGLGTVTVCAYREDSGGRTELRRLAYTGELDAEAFVTRNGQDIIVKNLKDPSLHEFLKNRKCRRFETNDKYCEFLKELGVFYGRGNKEQMRPFFHAYRSLLNMSRGNKDDILSSLVYNSAGVSSGGSSEIDMSSVQEHISNIRSSREAYRKRVREYNAFKVMKPLAEEWETVFAEGERSAALLASSIIHHGNVFRDAERETDEEFRAVSEQKKALEDDIGKMRQDHKRMERDHDNWYKLDEKIRAHRSEWNSAVALEEALKAKEEENTQLIRQIRDSEEAMQALKEAALVREKLPSCVLDFSDRESLHAEIKRLESEVDSLDNELNALLEPSAAKTRSAKNRAELDPLLDRLFEGQNVPSADILPEILKRFIDDRERRIAELNTLLESESPESLERQIAEHENGRISAVRAVECDLLCDEDSFGFNDAWREAVSLNGTGSAETLRTLKRQAENIRDELEKEIVPPQGRSSDVLSDRLTRIRKDLAGSAKDIAEKDPALVPGDSREDGLKAQELVEREKASLVCGRQVGNFDPKRLEYLRTDRRRLQGELDRYGIFRTLSGDPAVRIPQEILVREERLSDLNEIFDTVRKETFVTKDMKDCSADLENERRKYAELLLRIDGLKTERADASLRKSLPFEIIRSGYSEEETRRVLQVLGELRSRAVCPEYLKGRSGIPGYVSSPADIAKSILYRISGDIYRDEHFVLDLSALPPAEGIDLSLSEEDSLSREIEKQEILAAASGERIEHLEDRLKVLEKELAISLRLPEFKREEKTLDSELSEIRRIRELLDILDTTEDETRNLEAMEPLFVRYKTLETLSALLAARDRLFIEADTLEKELSLALRRERLLEQKNFFRSAAERLGRASDHAAQERGLKERREIALGQKDQFIERDRAIERVACARSTISCAETQISLDRELEKSLAAEPKRELRKQSDSRRRALSDAMAPLYQYFTLIERADHHGGGEAAMKLGELTFRQKAVQDSCGKMRDLLGKYKDEQEAAQECLAKYRSLVPADREFTLIELGRAVFSLDKSISEKAEQAMSLGTKISRLVRIREDLTKALKSLDRWKRDMEEKNILGSFSNVYQFVRDEIRSSGTRDMELFRSEDLIEPLWREIAADRTKPIDLYERFSDSVSFHMQRVATAERTVSELREKLTQELANSGISQNDYPGLPFRNDLRFFSELVRILGTTYSSEEHLKKHYEELLESQRENYRSALHKSGDVLTKWKNYIDDFCSVMNRELRDIGGSDVSSISVTLRRTPLGTEMEALFDRLKETYAHVANQLSLDLDSGNFLTEPEENDASDDSVNSLSSFIAEHRIIRISDVFTVFVGDHRKIGGKDILVGDKASNGNSIVSRIIATATALRAIEGYGSSGGNGFSFRGSRNAVIPISMDEIHSLDNRNSGVVFRYLDKYGFIVVGAGPSDLSLERKNAVGSLLLYEFRKTDIQREANGSTFPATVITMPIQYPRPGGGEFEGISVPETGGMISGTDEEEAETLVMERVR